MTEENKELKIRIREVLEESLNNSFKPYKDGIKRLKKGVFNINIPEKIIDDLLKQESFVNWLEKNKYFENYFCNGVIFEKMDKETIKKILKLLPIDKLKEIKVKNIPNNEKLLRELIENNDEESIRVVKFLNYNDNGYFFRKYDNKEIINIIIDKDEEFAKKIINNNIMTADRIRDNNKEIQNNNKEFAKKIIDEKPEAYIRTIVNSNKEIAEKIINEKKINDIKIIKTLPIYTLIQIKRYFPEYILDSKEYRKIFIEKFIKRYPIYWNFTDEMFEELSEEKFFYNEIAREEHLCEGIKKAKELRHGLAFENLKLETVKNFLFSNLSDERVADIGAQYISNEILENLLKDFKNNHDEKSFSLLKLLNYKRGNVFKNLKPETAKEILKILPDGKIKKIYADFISEDLFKELLTNKAGQNIVKLLHYYEGAIFKNLKPETAKEILKILPDGKIKKIHADFISEDLFKELLTNKAGQNIVKLLYYYEGAIFKNLKPETAKEILKILPDDKIKKINPRYISEDLFKELLGDGNGKNIIKLLEYGSGYDIFKNLKSETIEEILKILPDDKIKKIYAKYIPKDLLEKLLKNNTRQNMLKLLDYGSGYDIFKKIKPETIEEILKILPDDKIKKINPQYIPEDLLEKLLKDKDEGQNIIKLLDYGSGYGKFENLKSETIEEILKILPDDKIKKIYAKYIPKDLLKTLLKTNTGQGILKLINYEINNYNNKFQNLDSKTIEEILRILSEDKIKGIYIEYIPTDILINCIKKPNENKELYNNILFLKCNDDSCSYIDNFIRDNKQFKKFLNDSSNIEYIKKFLLDLNDIKRFYLIKYMNINILKDILLSLTKEELNKIYANDIYSEKFKELVSIIEQDKYFKILTSLNYSNGKYFNIKNVIYNNKKTSEENKELAKNFLLELGEEKIKNFDSEDIKTILTDDLFKDSINDNLKKELVKKLIKKNSYRINIKKIFKNIDEFVEIIKSDDISQEEANEINLSYFEYYAEDSIVIIEKLLKECPNKLPEINISESNGKLLFDCLEKVDLKVENIRVKSNNLNFLEDDDKFRTIKKIIKNKSLFLRTNNNEINYNKEVLEILTSLLTKNEIISFVKFYCKNNNEQEIEFDEKKLRNCIGSNNLFKKIEGDYFVENKELEVSRDNKSYLENRQENLYSLLKVLKDKLNKRLNKLKKFKGELNKDVELRKRDIEENINKLKDYIQYLDLYRKVPEYYFYEDTESLCDKDRAKEILYFIIERYSEEVLRRGILDYRRRIESFVKNNEYLKDKVNEITEEVEKALGILYNPYAPDEFKLEAQEILKRNIKLIGDKYKEVANKRGEDIIGSYLIFSTICEAKNIDELNNALYASIRTRMANDYLIKVYDKSSGLKIKTNVLYRGYTGENFNAEEVSDILISDPSAETGRLKYSFWDMTYDKSKINDGCVASGASYHGSAISSFTSYSENVGVALSVYGAGGLLSFYCIPDNLKKTYNDKNGWPTVLEFAGYDVPLEYRIFNIIFDGEVPKEENAGKTADDDEEFKVKAVKFNKKMNFVIFRLNLNLKKDLEINYKNDKGDNVKKTFAKDQKNLIVTEEQLEAIIKILAERGELIPFLRDQLVIERIFDKDKILGEETKKSLKEKIETQEDNVQKILNVEKGIVNAQRKFRQEVFNSTKINNKKSLDSDLYKKTMYYAIPDIHGSIDAFREDLVKTGLIANDGNGEYIYYKKDDYRLINPIYEKPVDEEEYIKVPKLTINYNFEDKVVQLGDLVDNHSGEDTSDSLACLATSVLLSRQLNGKYVTLIGNHEIAKLAGNSYCMEFKDAEYEQSMIIEAIKNDEIKLMYHVPGTNIINSHVELVKNHIENFLNKIEENKDFFKNFENFDSKIERLLKIVGFEKDNEGKYIESNNKMALLDNNPSEEDLEDFTNIINDLFKYIVVTEYEKGKKIPFHGLTHSLVYRSLVTNSRLYSSGKGFGNAAAKLHMGCKDGPLTPEELGQLTFKGITNVIGHDATPNKEKIEEKEYELSQEKYLNNARILFTDEWQEKGKARCVKIESDRENNKKYYFYRQEDYKNEFIEGNFVEVNKKRKELEKQRKIRNENFFELASDMINENNFDNQKEKELFEIILKNIPRFFEDECPTLDYCNIKNSDKVVELSRQLFEFMKDNSKEKREFIDQLIDDNFFKDYNDEEMFNNCINEIDIFNRKEEIEQEESKAFFNLTTDMTNKNNFDNQKEKELFEIILKSVNRVLSDTDISLNNNLPKNKIKTIKLSRQLLEFMKNNNEEKREFINKLINDNFFENYNDEEIFNNCINEIDKFNRKKEIEQKESEDFFELASDIINRNNFYNRREKELFEIISGGVARILTNKNILLNNNLPKNKIKIIKLSKQLLELINSKNKKEKKIIDQLIEVNFNKKYDENTIFVNCINEIDKVINDNQITIK